MNPIAARLPLEHYDRLMTSDYSPASKSFSCHAERESKADKGNNTACY